MPDAEVDPLEAARRPSSVGDAWMGARTGNRMRRAIQDAQRTALRRSMSEVDIGEPAAPRVVLAFLAMTLFATLVEFQRFGMSPTARELDTAGGMSAIALARGDWWSVVTGNLLHGSIEHIVLNVFVIYLVGRWLELLIGRWATAGVIGFAALGSAAGAVYAAPLTVTIGASGVAFGLIGCGLVVDWRARTQVGMLARTLGFVSIIGSFVIPGISIGGHAGGLVAGVLLGLIVWDRTASPEHPIGRTRRAPAIIIAVTSIALLGFLVVWSTIDVESARSVGTDIGEWLARNRTDLPSAG